MHATHLSRHLDRPGIYKPYEASYPIIPEHYPVPLEKHALERMEDLFGVNINVFMTEVDPSKLDRKFKIQPGHVSTLWYPERPTIELLLLVDVHTGNGHYTWIKRGLSALLCEKAIKETSSTFALGVSPGHSPNARLTTTFLIATSTKSHASTSLNKVSLIMNSGVFTRSRNCRW